MFVVGSYIEAIIYSYHKELLMFIVESYTVAIIMCFITMICWGSWANTQKLAGSRWRFELFYWDYVLGVLLMSLIFALTMGSMGADGRSFLADLRQAEGANIGSAFLGGMVFNAANILLVASIAVAAEPSATSPRVRVRMSACVASRDGSATSSASMRATGADAAWAKLRAQAVMSWPCT